MKRIVFYLILLFSLISLNSCNNNKHDGEYNFETSLFTNNNTLPVINIHLNNTPAKLIIDTGSEINIINSEYYYRHMDSFVVIDTHFTEIQTLSGTLYEESYIVKSYINDSIPIIFNVMNINNTIDNIFLNQQDYIDGIIGCEFLYNNKLIVDFNNKKLTNLNKNASI